MPTVRGTEFDRVLDLQDDLGLPPGGDAAAVIENALSRPGTLVDVPPGEYHISRQVRVGSDRTGIRGTGAERTDVVFTVPQTFGDYWLYFDRVDGPVVENVSVQWGWDRAAGLVVISAGDAYVGNYEILGPKPQHSNGGIRGMYYDVTDPGGVGILEEYHATGPGEYVRAGQSYAVGLQGLLTDGAHQGTLHVRDCDLRNWTENGLYCSRPSGGIVTVERCYLENIDNAAVRLSTPGSFIRDSTVVVDPEQANPDNEWPDGMNNPRGIWLEHITGGGGGVSVENCDVIYRNPSSMLRALAGTLHVDSTMGAVDVLDSRFYTEVDEDNLHFNVFVNNASSLAFDPVEVIFENCDFVGPADAAAIRSEQPFRSTVIDCCIDMPDGGELQVGSDSGTQRGGCSQPDDSPDGGQRPPAQAGLDVGVLAIIGMVAATAYRRYG